MKNDTPSVVETLFWILLAAFLIWSLIAGPPDEDEEDTCIRVRRIDKDYEIKDCEELRKTT